MGQLNLPRKVTSQDIIAYFEPPDIGGKRHWWTPEKIRAEIESTGKSAAIEQIKAQVKADNCYCEVPILRARAAWAT